MSGSASHASADDDDEGIDLEVASSWIDVISAFGPPPKNFSEHGTAKTVGTAGMTVSSIGISAAQLGTSTSSLAVAGAIAAGAAVSATGVGLVVVGGALMLAGIGINAASMVKSTAHVVALKKIRGDIGSYAKCVCKSASISPDMACDHSFIADKVLSYIIHQKTEKAVKKGVGILPGVGLLSNIYRLGRFAFKKDRGKKRSFYAHVLTRHLVTHDCALAGAIVAQLYSANEMLLLRMFNSQDALPLIARKMKSV